MAFVNLFENEDEFILQFSYNLFKSEGNFIQYEYSQQLFHHYIKIFWNPKSIWYQKIAEISYLDKDVARFCFKKVMTNDRKVTINYNIIEQIYS